MSKDTLQIQKLVMDYFENYDNDTVANFINSFVYLNPAKNSNISKLVEKFLEDNDIVMAYLNVTHDKRNEKVSFFRSTLSQSSIIEDINIALLNLSYNRFLNAQVEIKKEESKNKKNFNFIKKELLKCYECLNSYENYFNGKEGDEEFVEKIKSIKYE